MAKNKSVFGIYSTRSEVESAVNALKDAGFSNSDVSVLLPENIGSKELVTKELITKQSTKGPEGAAFGAGSGAAVGGALGWLVGVGALAIPGIGPVIAAGPLVAALAGIGIGGALGGFAGSLVGMGIPEQDARALYGERVKGGVLVVVHCQAEDESQRAQHALRASGAQDIAVPSDNLAEAKNAA